MLLLGRWSDIRRAVKASATWQRPPTEIIGLGYREWTEVDSALAQAYTVLEGSQCPGCGQSLLRMSDEDAIGHIQVKDHWCESCVVLDRDRKAAGDDQPAGRHVFPVDTGNH